MKVSMDDLYLFVLTVRHGGISAAAKAYSLQRSKVSRRLQELEKAVGSQLQIRTTRHIELTENGRLLYEQVNQPLTMANQAVNLLENQQKEMQCVLRIAVPAALITSRMFAELIDKYAVRFPNVLLDIQHSQESLDLKRDNIDLQLLPNILKVVNEDYVQQTLLPFPCCLVASPGYVATHGTPNDLTHLMDHRILVSRFNSTALDDGLMIRLCSDDLRLIHHMAKSAHGIALLPTIFVRDAVAAGELVHVLSGARFPEIKLILIYPSREYLPEKTRVMIQLLRETITNDSVTL